MHDMMNVMSEMGPDKSNHMEVTKKACNIRDFSMNFSADIDVLMCEIIDTSVFTPVRKVIVMISKFIKIDNNSVRGGCWWNAIQKEDHFMDEASVGPRWGKGSRMRGGGRHGIIGQMRGSSGGDVRSVNFSKKETKE